MSKTRSTHKSASPIMSDTYTIDRKQHFRLCASSATRDSVSTGFFETIRNKQRSRGGGDKQSVQTHNVCYCVQAVKRPSDDFETKNESQRGRKVLAGNTQVTKHTIMCTERNKTSKTPRSWRFRPTASQHRRGWKVCERVLTVRPRKRSQRARIRKGEAHRQVRISET